MSEPKEPSAPHPATEQENEDLRTAASALARASAHEVNNALTAVRGYLDLARSRIEEDHACYEALIKADQAAEAAATVVREFLSATRPNGNLAPGGTLSQLIEEARTLLREHIHAPATRSPAPAPAPRTPELVLVGENDTFVRSILISGLRAAGYEVRLGGGKTQLIEMCREQAGRSIVMVLDLELEDLGGLQGAREIQRSCHGVPMILLSAKPPPGDFTGGSSEPAEDEAPGGPPARYRRLHWIRKPFPMANLLELVERCGKESPESGDHSSDRFLDSPDPPEGR